MRQVSLGTAGLKVSAEGLGCMSMSTTYGPSDEKESLTTLRRAVDLGVSFYDTAESYGLGHNERLVGRALAPFRDDVTIATKVGFAYADDGRMETQDGQPVVDGRPVHIARAIEGSLTRLAVERIDLAYLHRIDSTVPIEETVAALADLVQAGKVGYLGLSEASAETIRRANAVHPITAVQTEYSLFERGVEANGVLPAVRELGIGFVAYSPLGRGLLTGRLKPEQLDATDFRNSDPRLHGENLTANLRIVDAIGRIAADRGAKPAQLAIAWTIAQGAVPIPGTRRVRYLEENVEAVEISLEDSEMAALEEVAPIGAASGDRYSTANMALLTR